MSRVVISMLLFCVGVGVFAQEPKPPVRRAEKKGESVTVALNTGGHTTAISSMVFTPDGSKLITSEQSQIHVWKMPSGELERTWRLPSTIDMIAVSANGSTVAAMGNVEVNPVWLLDMKTGDSKTFKIEGVAGHYSANGKLVWR